MIHRQKAVCLCRVFAKLSWHDFVLFALSRGADASPNRILAVAVRSTIFIDYLIDIVASRQTVENCYSMRSEGSILGLGNPHVQSSLLRLYAQNSIKPICFVGRSGRGLRDETRQQQNAFTSQSALPHP
jgi:hypothetical protein